VKKSAYTPLVSTFVVRVWCETSVLAPRWRGRIEHLQTGQGAAFQDLERIAAFIRASGAFADDRPGPSAVPDPEA
jgi:hypothetical protein